MDEECVVGLENGCEGFGNGLERVLVVLNGRQWCYLSKNTSGGPKTGDDVAWWLRTLPGVEIALGTRIGG
jgi:hypothetical protein